MAGEELQDGRHEERIRHATGLDETQHLRRVEIAYEDVLRALAKAIDDPFDLRDAAERALNSPGLIRIDDADGLAFTTREFRDVELGLAHGVKPQTAWMMPRASQVGP